MGDIVDARLSLRCELLHLAPPPVAARLSVSQTAGVWRLNAECLEGHPSQLVEWISKTDPIEIVIDGSGRLSAHSRDPPGVLAILSSACVAGALIEPTGAITLAVRGERSDLQALAARLQGGSGEMRLQHVTHPSPSRSVLTQPQDEAIRAAASAGYYKIPRALNLCQLAEQLGVSPASISERLRRAEARLVQRYVESPSDAHPPSSSVSPGFVRIADATAEE